MVSQLATLLPTKDISYIGLVWNCTIGSILSKKYVKGGRTKGIIIVAILKSARGRFQ